MKVLFRNAGDKLTLRHAAEVELFGKINAGLFEQEHPHKVIPVSAAKLFLLAKRNYTLVEHLGTNVPDRPEFLCIILFINSGIYYRVSRFGKFKIDEGNVPVRELSFKTL